MLALCSQSGLQVTWCWLVKKERIRIWAHRCKNIWKVCLYRPQSEEAQRSLRNYSDVCAWWETSSGAPSWNEVFCSLHTSKATFSSKSCDFLPSCTSFVFVPVTTESKVTQKNPKKCSCQPPLHSFLLQNELALSYYSQCLHTERDKLVSDACVFRLYIKLHQLFFGYQFSALVVLNDSRKTLVPSKGRTRDAFVSSSMCCL